jgi:glutamine amidotransferase
VVAIVSIGLGNVASVQNMLHYLGIDARLCEYPDGLGERDRYILPGVGAFDEGVRRLKATGWYSHLASLPKETQILGICLGMQMLGQSSEEGSEEGLGRVPAHFKRFPDGQLPVPHMGWNHVNPAGDDSLFDPAFAQHRFYFTHSYRAVVEDSSSEIGRTTYGISFTSAYRAHNTRGVQFHPEKSHRFGMSLLARWAALPC